MNQNDFASVPGLIADVVLVPAAGDYEYAAVLVKGRSDPSQKILCVLRRLIGVPGGASFSPYDTAADGVPRSLAMYFARHVYRLAINTDEVRMLLMLPQVVATADLPDAVEHAGACT